MGRETESETETETHRERERERERERTETNTPPLAGGRKLIFFQYYFLPVTLISTCVIIYHESIL